MRPKFAILMLWLTASILIFHVTSAQTEPPLAYLLQNEQVSQVNVLSGESTLITDLTPLLSLRSEDPSRIDRRLWAADIDPAGRNLYQIEAWGHSANRRILGAPIGAELVKIDLINNTREVIFDNTKVFNFVISPNGEKILIFFYGDEYLYSTQLACILSFEINNCIPLNFDYVSADGFWIDDKSLVIGTNDINPLRLIDAANGKQTILNIPQEWYVYWATPMPQTKSLVINTHPKELLGTIPPISFIVYNIETGITNLLSYTALSGGKYVTVNELLLSPDARYLLYKGEYTALVDFNSGELIQEFTSVSSVNWIDNTTFLMQGRVGDEPTRIMRVDAASHQITTLIEGEKANGILLFP